MLRLVGFSDVAVLASVAQIDTFGFRDVVGLPAVGTWMNLQVEKQLMGQPVSSPLPIRGVDVFTQGSEKAPVLDPFGEIERKTGLKTGVRGIFLLRADPKDRCWALVPGGLFVVETDTIVVESRWGGRRWLENISKPLIHDGVDVGNHIRVEDMAGWLSMVEMRRLLGLRQRRATLVADAVMLNLIPRCNVPLDAQCFRVGINHVYYVDRDSVARSDKAREASPFNETGIALDHASGARDGAAIKVLLPGFFADWIGQRMLLLLEPGPAGSNIWLPAMDGYGAQPVESDVMVRSNLPLNP